MVKLQYGCASVRAHARGGLIHATVRGEVTQLVARSIIGGAPLWSPVRSSQVVDYSRARVKLSAEALFAAARAVAIGDTPTALVVGPDQLVMFADYARMAVEQGVLKQAFTSFEAAHRWAAAQAAVAEYQVRLARSRRACP